MLAVGSDESLGSFRIDGCSDGSFAPVVNDRLGSIFALLLGFEPIAVAEVLPLNPEIDGEGPVATLPVLNRYHRVSKCEVNMALNKGV